MSYDDEDTYHQVQDERIELAGLASQPIPAQRPYRLDAALLSPGDLIRVPDGGTATVGRVFPFGNGAASATVECELEDEAIVQLVLDDVLLLATAGAQAVPYPRWTGAPA